MVLIPNDIILERLVKENNKLKRMNDKNLKMRNDIMDVIHEAGINFKCSGFQSENDSDLSLEEWSMDDPDAVVNQILGIVGDYISEML